MQIQVKARNRAYKITAGDADKILFAGLRAEIALPYECATGTCGTCKARLLSGEIHDAWPDAPGRKYCRSAGEFLMCQCVARSDLEIEVGNFVYAVDPGARLPDRFSGTIRRPRRLTHDVMAFSVDLDAACGFDAGQFMALAVPGVEGARGYSMVNFDRQARALDFVVKRKPGGGVSEWLFGGDRDGAKVSLFGPLGHAVFNPGVAKNILCIAGGSGIAGMMSILSRACQERYFAQYRGYVFFGVRTMQDAFFLDELAGFRRDSADRLEIVLALSDGEVPSTAAADHPGIEFDTGLVHQVAARRMAGKFANTRAYLAGPPPAVDGAIRMLLLEAKLTADNIRYDKFS